MTTSFIWIIPALHLNYKTNLSPTDVFSGHYDYELFLLQKEIDAPHDNISHEDTHVYEEQDHDVILTHATILSHTFALPQFMDQHNCEDQEPTDTPSTVPTAFQVSCDHTCILSVLITQWQSSATSTLTLITTSHYSNFWHITIMKTWIPLTLQVQYQPLSKLPVMRHTTLSVLITQWKPSAINPNTPH